jgi:hypothetical protein
LLRLLLLRGERARRARFLLLLGEGARLLRGEGARIARLLKSTDL